MKREKEISKFMADPKFLIARSYSNYKMDTKKTFVKAAEFLM